MKTFGIIYFLFTFLIFHSPSTAQNKKMARVQRLDGVEVYILSEPMREYEVVTNVQTGLKAESLLTAGLFNESITDKVLQFIRRAKKTGALFDAVLYSGGKSVVAIKFMGPSSSKNKGIAQVRNIVDVEVYILSEPLTEYETITSSGGEIKWKSLLSAGLVNNSIEEDITGFIKKQRNNGVDFDGIIYNGGKSALSFKYKHNGVSTDGKLNNQRNSNEVANQHRPQLQPEQKRQVLNNTPSAEKKPPVITVISPSTKSLTVESAESKVMLVGKVQDDSEIESVFINNRLVLLEDDVFSSEESLPRVGQNIFTIKATDIHGNTATKQVMVNSKKPLLTGDQKSKTAKPEPIITGRYYALLIANEDYSDVSKLNFPAKDARDLKGVLEQKYRFQEVKLLVNQSVSQIAKELELLSKSLEENDNLLIFYSGHGYYKKETDRGYLLGVDSRKDDRTTWLALDELRSFIKSIEVKHILLILDACYSGKIFRNTKSLLPPPISTQELLKFRSRTAMTSGDLTEVPDVSAFNKYFIQKLQENTNPFLSDAELFYSFRDIVLNNTPKNPDGSLANPQFGAIAETNHEGGSFIFPLKK